MTSQEIGELLKDWRTRHNISKYQLGKITKKRIETITSVEAGTSTMANYLAYLQAFHAIDPSEYLVFTHMVTYVMGA